MLDRLRRWLLRAVAFFRADSAGATPPPAWEPLVNLPTYEGGGAEQDNPSSVPVAVDDHHRSADPDRSPDNHEWQQGSHIDSMPIQRPRTNWTTYAPTVAVTTTEP